MFKKFYWSDYSEKELLKLKFRDLGLDQSFAPKRLQNHFNQVIAELESKNIPFRPHFWCSDEWFCPDGIAGIAIPFYLYHPVLKRLERRLMGSVEGETKREFQKLLRHEIGHAMDNAYGLRRLKSRQKLFGLSSKSYPNSYKRPVQSDSYVDYLGDGYASSHPDEDWAETFATWLDPNSQWGRKYRSGVAREKLEYMDRLMKSLAGKPPKQTDKIYWSLQNINMTLGEYYRKKMKRFKVRQKHELLQRLSKVFAVSGTRIPATVFLKENKQTVTSYLKQNTSDSIDFAGPLYNDLLTFCKNQELEFGASGLQNLPSLSTPAFRDSILKQYSRITM